MMAVVHELGGEERRPTYSVEITSLRCQGGKGSYGLVGTFTHRPPGLTNEGPLKEGEMANRTWIKLFCDNWFDGSIRRESLLVRSLFTDILVLAGRLGTTGVISLPGGVCGYSDEQFAKILNISVKDWKGAKDRLSNHPDPKENRIEVNSENVITVLKWDIYQSEYDKRRDRHRNKPRAASDAARSIPDTRAESIAAPEGEGEGEGEKKRSKSKASSDRSDPTSTPGPYPEPQDQPLLDSKGEGAGSKPQVLVDAWNVLCPNLPRVGVVSDKRVVKVKARLKQAPIEYWKAVFTKMNTTPFLKGENDRGWKATFDWIINQIENADKVLSGAYDSAPKRRDGRILGGAAPQPGKYAEWERSGVVNLDNPGPEPEPMSEPKHEGRG